MKKKLAVIFGSRSVEHDVSIVTGVQLGENIDRETYDVLPVYIDRTGEWFTGEKLWNIEFLRNFDPNCKEITRVMLPPDPKVHGLVTLPAGGGLLHRAKSENIPIDVAIPALHGLHGEDGTVQGLLELADIPYASSGVLGSAVGMDKIVMKMAFLGAGIPVVKGEFFTRGEWKEDREGILNAMENAIGYPAFVKPANLGSSIGISRADSRDELAHGIDIAAGYDRRIIVERAVEDNIEINCSVLGYGAEVRASVCERPVSWKKFLTYEEKYLEGGKMGKASSGMASLSRIVPADIPDELTKEVQDLSVRIFKELDCKGVVRIDFLYDQKAHKLYANEINTIPGSFAFYLWEPMGVSFQELVDLMVDCAYRAAEEKRASNFAFASDILKKTGVGAKGAKGFRSAKR